MNDQKQNALVGPPVGAAPRGRTDLSDVPRLEAEVALLRAAHREVDEEHGQLWRVVSALRLSGGGVGASSADSSAVGRRAARCDAET